MERQNVKIKRVKKGGDHGGHHGGSWKVAYADFVTAMMAFFLLMWLVTAKKMEEKVGIATYFNDYDITKGESDIKKKIDEKIKKYKLVLDQNSKDSQAIKLVLENNTAAARQILQDWKSEVQLKLNDVSDQIMVEITEDGAIMIQLVDKEGAPMFPPGSSDLSPVAKKILEVIWEKVKLEGVKIAIEGHTDAHRYSASGKTNWELSTERASAARKELERLGFQPENLLRVTGLADTKPISNDPFSPTNRRISLLLYYFTPPDPSAPIPETETGTEPSAQPTTTPGTTTPPATGTTSQK